MSEIAASTNVGHMACSVCNIDYALKASHCMICGAKLHATDDSQHYQIVSLENYSYIDCPWCDRKTPMAGRCCIRCGAITGFIVNFNEITDMSIVDLKISYAERFSNLSGVVFEQLIGSIFKQRGFNVKYTATSGDFGIDLLVTSNGLVTGVQTKLRDNRPISSKHIGELLVGQLHYEVDKLLFVTNSYFSDNARKTAIRGAVELWDWEKLSSELQEAYPFLKPDASGVKAANLSEPLLINSAPAHTTHPITPATGGTRPMHPCVFWLVLVLEAAALIWIIVSSAQDYAAHSRIP